MGFSTEFELSLYQSVALEKLYNFGIRFTKIGLKLWPQIEPEVGGMADSGRSNRIEVKRFKTQLFTGCPMICISVQHTHKHLLDEYFGTWQVGGKERSPQRMKLTRHFGCCLAKRRCCRLTTRLDKFNLLPGRSLGLSRPPNCNMAGSHSPQTSSWWSQTKLTKWLITNGITRKMKMLLMSCEINCNFPCYYSVLRINYFKLIYKFLSRFVPCCYVNEWKNFQVQNNPTF